jgi:hypothetical protein
MEETETPKGVFMKKILASVAAAAVLVAGIATAAVITSSSASAQESDEPAPAFEKPQRGSILVEVLDDLVAGGDIGLTQAQADAIVEAMQEKWEELEASRPEGRRGPGHRGFRSGARLGFHMGELLADGVIDADELAGLPDGHPLTNPDGPFGEALADGQITEQEFQDVLEALRAEREGGGRFGPRFGSEEPDVEGASV